jgi:O-antigen/teichoic acid export membrane protein
MIATLRRKFKSLTSDKKFSEILTGSVWALAARVVATVLGLVTSIIIARMYGAEMVGILAVIQAFLMFATIVTVLGTNMSILRLIPEHVAKYSVTSAFKVYRKTQYFVGGGSLLVGVVLFFASDLIAAKIFAKPHLSYYFTLASGVVVFRSLMDLNTQAIRGLRLIKVFSFMQVLPSAAVLLALVTLTLLHGGPNSPVYAQMIAWGITAIVGAWIMNYVFRKRMRPDDLVQGLPLREILDISTPMMMTASMQFVIGQTGVILLGIFRPEAEVGYYAVAVKLATLTSFVLSAINSMAAPKFSELYHTGAMDELFYVARKSTRLIFWITVPILLVLLIAGGPILGVLFGEGFTVAYPAMVLLVVGQFVSSISGSTGIFMNMTGHEKVYRNVILIAGLINVALNFLLVPHFGITGAACAGMVSLVFLNFYLLSFINHIW